MRLISPNHALKGRGYAPRSARKKGGSSKIYASIESDTLARELKTLARKLNTLTSVKPTLASVLSTLASVKPTLASAKLTLVSVLSTLASAKPALASVLHSPARIIQHASRFARMRCKFPAKTQRREGIKTKDKS
jgi:hypothetical protein